MRVSAIATQHSIVHVNEINVRKIEKSNSLQTHYFDSTSSEKARLALLVNTINGLNKNMSFNNSSKVAFRGTPERLPKRYIATEEDAIEQYDYLKHGKYLDIHDDIYNPENRDIRSENLSFLDKLVTQKEKKVFINYFEGVTGFPNLKDVSINIENEFKNSILRASDKLLYKKYECISAGYDETCSVGKRFAFPGSDLDKAFIIIRGTDNDKANKEIVNKFKGELWDNTDQRILSYNHDTSFPTVMTVKQVLDQIREIDLRTQSVQFDRESMSNLVESEYKDLEKAADYNILVSYKFDVKNRQLSSSNALTKEDVKNFGYFIESLRDGKKIIDNTEGQSLIEEINDYDFYKFSNVAQIRAMKNAIKSGKEQKAKIVKRQSLEDNFNKWTIDEQYNFVKNLIKYSCEDQSGYEDYFSNDYDIKAKYKPLLGILTKGDRSEFFVPEFSKIKDGIRMKYGTDQSVNLYSGYSNNVLWVDSKNPRAITRVLEDIDRVKTIKQFNNVNIVQCPRPSGEVKNFGPINFYTANRSQIYEARI